jgi:hypothetical protein
MRSDMHEDDLTGLCVPQDASGHIVGGAPAGDALPTEAVDRPPNRDVAEVVHRSDRAGVAVAERESEQRLGIYACDCSNGLGCVQNLSADLVVRQRCEAGVADRVVAQPVSGGHYRACCAGKRSHEVAGEEERRGDALDREGGQDRR